MTPQVRTFARCALRMLPVWTALLFLSTLMRQPDPQTAFADFSAYITTTQFLFYNQVYAVPLFATAILGLLLFMAGGVFIGSAIAAEENTNESHH